MEVFSCSQPFVCSVKVAEVILRLTREVLICPFCGSEELIKDSDAVAVEKIRQKTTFMKWEREDAKRKEKERSAYRNSKAGIVALVFAFICGGGCIGSSEGASAASRQLATFTTYYMGLCF